MAFGLLPLDVIADIGGYLDDQSLGRFSSVCRVTHEAINLDNSPVWRVKFVEHYDLPPANNKALKDIYQWRRKRLRRGADFRLGRTRSEYECLQVLRDLMLDSFASGCIEEDADGKIISRNMQAIRTFALSNSLLSNVLRPSLGGKQTPLLLAIQIMLTSLRFHPDMLSIALGFVDAQKVVYSSAEKEPIFRGKNKTDVNLNFVINTIEFFKHHLGSEENPEMYSAYKELCSFEKIKPWRKALKDGAQPLGKHWKGAYSYLEHDQVSRLRRMPKDEDEVFMDIFNLPPNGGDPFQTLKLDFSGRTSAKRWPKIFEKHLHSLSHPSATFLAKEKTIARPGKPGRTTRAQFRAEVPASSRTEKSKSENNIDPKPISFNFLGSGSDDEKFFAAGWLNPLPRQEQIPGWMRWTMMKFFVNEDSDAEETARSDPFSMHGLANPFQNMDENALWAYEGVVLPGGEIVVGRWWSPKHEDDDEGDNEEVYSGPFMFWCVDGEPA